MSPSTKPQTTVAAPGRWQAAATFLPVLVALPVYLIGLSRPLSPGERALVTASARPLPELFSRLLDNDAGLGLYPVLMHAWLQGGDSAFWLRLPSAVAMLLAVVLVTALARRWWGVPGAVAGGCFLAVSPMGIRYAGEVNPHVLAVQLAVLSVWLLLRASGQERWTWWIAYSVTLTLLGLVEPAALLVILAHPLLLAAGRVGSRPVNYRQWLLSVLDGVVVPAVLVVLAFTQRPRSAGTDPTLADLLGSYAEVSGGVTYAALLGVAAVVGAVGSREFPCLLVWYGLPPLVLALLGLLVPVFAADHLVFCGPALTLLAAAGLRRAVGWQVLLVCLMAAALAAPAWWELRL